MLSELWVVLGLKSSMSILSSHSKKVESLLKQKGLHDADPYVKQNAVRCVPKVYEISPELVEQENMISTLKELFMEDKSFKVVANSIQSLQEISQLSGVNHLKIEGESLKRVLLCINESFEWGQVSLLDILSEYAPERSEEAEQ